jgi:hypothetical protein
MQIIGFLGRKQSGKNTSSNIIHGYELMRHNMVRDFKINEDGKLSVLTSNSNGELDWGIFDVTRKDEQFVEWSHTNMWPHIKNYAFADRLKEIAISMFDISRELAYGTDEQKNTVVPHLLWENMPGVVTPESKGNIQSKLNAEWLNIILHDSGPMTIREFLQFFGSEIMRKMWEPIWIHSLIKQIQEEKSELAIITDVRFVNEAQAIKEAGGIIIKLNRKKKTKDTHVSEEEVDRVPSELIDYQIMNNKKNYTVSDLQQEIKNIYDNIVL